VNQHLSGLPARLSETGRPLVLAVLNVTPDSFSDGGRWFDTASAIERGRQLAAAGGDIVDVGGESTRPGAERVEAAEELRRVLPVVSALAAEGIAVSIDTMRAEVAQAAVSAGAVLINDVSGGLADPAMAGTVAGLGCPYVLMHWRAPAARMAEHAGYHDPVGEVLAELSGRLDAMVGAGVAPERIALDPGIGFAKDAEHNWAVLAGLDRLATLGRPMLVGVSRKRFLGTLLSDADGPRPVDRRDGASAVLAGLLAAAGVWAVRAHDAAATRDALLVGAAWAASGPA